MHGLFLFFNRGFFPFSSGLFIAYPQHHSSPYYTQPPYSRLVSSFQFLYAVHQHIASRMPVRKTTSDKTHNFNGMACVSSTCSTSTSWYRPLPSRPLSHVLFAQLLWRAGPPIASDEKTLIFKRRIVTVACCCALVLSLFRQGSGLFSLRVRFRRSKPRGTE